MAKVEDVAIVYAIQKMMDIEDNDFEKAKALIGKSVVIGKVIIPCPLTIGKRWKHQISNADFESATIPF